MENLPETTDQTSSSVFQLPVAELIAHVADLDVASAETERQVKDQAIECKSLALAAIIRELARRRAGLSEETEPSEEALLAAANSAVQSLGLQERIARELVFEPHSPAAQEEGQRIREMRRRLGLTQEELARLAGKKSRFVINRLETGSRAGGYREMSDILKAEIKRRAELIPE